MDTTQSSNYIWKEQLVTLLAQEKTYQVPIANCRFGVINNDDIPGQINQPPCYEWRAKICQWSFDVIDHFGLNREIVIVALNLLDRFLLKRGMVMSPEESSLVCHCNSCAVKDLDSRMFQLTAMTSLYLAYKIHIGSCGLVDNIEIDDKLDNKDMLPLAVQSTIPARKFSLASFVKLSRGQFRAGDLIDMERVLLTTLEWKVHPPTPTTIVSLFLRLLPKSVKGGTHDLVHDVLHEITRYLTELSCGFTTTAYSPPSHIAYASILVGMDMLTYSALSLPIRHDFQESVASLSANKLTPHDKRIHKLQELMHNVFLLELFFDDNMIEIDHPLLMAKQLGLLKINQHHPTEQQGKKCMPIITFREETTLVEEPRRYKWVDDWSPFGVLQ